MEEIKERINLNLSTLNKVVPKRYTAMELHSNNGHLLNRVQRKENKRYYKNVDLRKKKLNEDLAKIQTYYDALAVEVERRALPLEEPTLLVRSTVLSAPILQPIDSVVPKPSITLRQLPVNVRSRIFSRPRLRRNR